MSPWVGPIFSLTFFWSVITSEMAAATAASRRALSRSTSDDWMPRRGAADRSPQVRTKAAPRATPVETPMPLKTRLTVGRIDRDGRRRGQRPLGAGTWPRSACTVVIDENLESPQRALRALLPRLVAHRSGSVVAVGSRYVERPWSGRGAGCQRRGGSCPWPRLRDSCPSTTTSSRDRCLLGLHVDGRPISEGREATRHERVSSTDVGLVLRAKVGVLREILERLPHLVGAGIEAVVDVRRNLHRLQVVADGIEGVGEIVPRVRAAAHREHASIP